MERDAAPGRPGPPGHLSPPNLLVTPAWRYWLASDAGRLRSVSHPGVEWPLDGPLQARCLHGGHPAPAPGCACGVYGAPDLAALRGHGLCVGTRPVVVGRVDLLGPLVADEDGLRAPAGRPVALWLVPETVGRRPLQALVARLGDYGVPVATMAAAEATEGATAAMLRFQAMSAGSGPGGGAAAGADS